MSFITKNYLTLLAMTSTERSHTCWQKIDKIKMGEGCCWGWVIIFRLQIIHLVCTVAFEMIQQCDTHIKCSGKDDINEEIKLFCNDM